MVSFSVRIPSGRNQVGPISDASLYTALANERSRGIIARVV